jgi:hypothetical protein
MKGLFLSTVLLGVACAGLAHANTVTGSYYHVPEAVSQNAVPGNVPAGTPDVTFSVDSPFSFAATNATVAAWLASGSAFNIVENTPGTLASLMDNNSVGSLLNFTGLVSVVTGQQFTVTHDDGLTLIINGLTVIDQPGPRRAAPRRSCSPTASTSTPWWRSLSKGSPSRRHGPRAPAGGRRPLA